MSGSVCISSLQCKLTGLFGTLVVICGTALAWVVFEGLSSGASIGLMLGLLIVPLWPTSCAVGLAVILRVMQRPPGWLALAAAAGGAVWAVIMLNMLERL
ncbi:hypothetical protein [Thalassovita taeanensis]|uniref:Uncharacterized protein n=1 Tax=Thalassovita taeanensis TaxID=657014 RepID=A0A1H9CMP3_9RHOB|nr:hypothetical protein [Thalassovita taeanensis]SEQ02475.1 hypothetical protein SAMN04488092_103318 [Thalassovita taeanensis]